MRRTSSLLIAFAIVLSACTATGARPQGEARALGARFDPSRVTFGAALTPFDACDAVLEYFKTEALARVGPYGLSGSGPWMPMLGRAGFDVGGDDAATFGEQAAGAPADGSFSGSNVQVAGVDEPDIVKTDGRRLLTLARNRLYAVDVTGRSPAISGSLDLGDNWNAEMLLSGDRALVFSTAPVAMPMARPASAGAASEPAPDQDHRPRTTVTVVDVADPAAMKVVTKLVFDGWYVSARMAGGIVRTVIRSEQPSGIAFTYPQDGTPRAEKAADDSNRKAIEQSTADQWLPRFAVLDGDKVTRDGRLASCDSTYHPSGFSGFGMTSVVTIDPADPTPREAASVAADAQTVYASASNLYVATNRWGRPAGSEPVADIAIMPSHSDTELHAFDITDPKQARYTGSGSVKGRLLNQWALSDHDGHLRVATTIDGPDSVSQVVTLALRGDKLEQVGQVGDLGRGEQIHAVRFMGDVGYVVTFRQIDPLYVIDLRDPAKPRVTGELKIPGYSAYLHPIADGYLLGVGQDATEEGQVLGTQVSVFDVRDPAKPARVHQRAIGGHSEAEFDHKAFLWWAASKLAVLPINEWTQTPFAGAVALTVDVASGIEERGRLTHDRGQGQGHAEPGEDRAASAPERHGEMFPIRRSVVVGGALYTVSDSGILASDLDSLTERGWAAFTQS